MKKREQKKNFFNFFSIMHFSYQYCIKFQTDRNYLKKDFVLRMLYEECSETNDGWCYNESLVFLYIVTFVYLSGRDHLCLLFFFLFKVFLQALAICTVLESEFRQDVQLWSSVKMK